MRCLFARIRALWRVLWRSQQLEYEMRDEMQFHIESEAERLMRERGLASHEARRQAYVAFGGVEKYKEESRDTRGRRWIDIVSLDIRLGVRLLVKHRGLTLVGAFAMAVAMAIGATAFELVEEMLDPSLPLDEGERVVALHYATPIPGSIERRVLHDFAEWRQQITSVEHLGAFRTAQHNLVFGPPPHEAITIAEITASAFTLARTPPLVGRYLLPSDEDESAPAVLVIGHQAWRSRFAGDPQIVGRTISLGGTPTTIVGVMPEEFKFPLDHQYWIPFRVNPLQYERLQGPRLSIFGRLAPGFSLQQAQAELTTIGQRTLAAHPGVYDRLRPVVLPYTFDQSGITPLRLWALRAAALLVAMLTFVVAVNLAILVYARTVTRLGEIALRTALGASRRRILGQLFIESLALSSVAAAAGLMLAAVALDQLQALRQRGLLIFSGDNPYWIDLELSVSTIVYALGLALVAALVMGVLPGIKATNRRVSANFRGLNSRTGARLGPVWTTLVVAQVAVAVAVLPMAAYMAWQVVQMGLASPDFAAEKFVVGVVATGEEVSTVETTRLQAAQRELTSRLESEPGVSAVTFSSGVPGFAPGRQFQFEDGPGVKYPRTELGIDSLDIGLDLFDTFSAEILAGRPFTAADVGTANTVIVNRTFAQGFVEVPRSTPVESSDGKAPPLDLRSTLGMRFRYVAPYERRGTRADTSYEIVGVVSDFPSFPPEPGSDGKPTIYHPVLPGTVDPLVLSVRFSGAVPAGFIDRFRVIAGEVDPTLQLPQVRVLSDFYSQMRSLWHYLAWGIALITVSVLLLSAAGIYAMMSFVVAQRSREIAIRCALGAAPRRLVFGIFRRATGQLALGLVVGSVFAGAMAQNTDLSPGQIIPFVLVVAATMAMVTLLAALGPARRGLRIQPSEVRKSDA